MVAHIEWRSDKIYREVVKIDEAIGSMWEAIKESSGAVGIEIHIKRRHNLYLSEAQRNTRIKRWIRKQLMLILLLKNKWK